MMLRGFEKYLKEVRGAIHVGANIGEERDWYKANKFTRVLWFEPNKELFPILEKNLENYPTQRALNFGIHDQLNKAVLHISNNAGQSSSILEFGTHSKWHPEVKFIKDVEIRLTRLDHFFETYHFDIKNYNFLNVDVQGVELNVIKSLGKMIEDIDYIYAEVNTEEVYKKCALITDIDVYLLQYDFLRVETIMTKANWGDAFYIKKYLK